MANQEPKRWAELGSDAPDGVQSLLHAAREDLPSQAELKAMGLIGGLLGPFDGGSDVAGPASKASPIGKAAVISSTSASVSKIALWAKLGATGLVVAGGATWLLQTPEPVADTPVIVATVNDVRPQTAPVDAAETAAPVIPPLPTASSETASPADAVPSVTPSGAHAANTSGPRTATAASEATLLQRAQASLSKSPERALALTEQHARQFPHGQLTQEREVIRIEALRRLGRDNQAEKVGRDFERQFPDSPHRRKLDQSTP